MPFASSSTVHAIRTRSIPFLTVSVLSISLFTVHSSLSPLHNDDMGIEKLSTSVKKQRVALSAAASPYTPLGWGSNRYLTLVSDPSTSVLKRPVPLLHLGATPLRDLVLMEKYGACVDARGDCWMWGAGYDQSGKVGRSLKGKRISSLAPASGKLIGLSRDGKLYVVSASKALQDRRDYRNERGWWSWLFGSDAGVDFVELKAEGGLKRGEKWSGVSAGQHHLLALTNKGRTFSLPLSPSANTHRQLGTRQIFETPFPVPTSAASAIPMSPSLPPESDPRFATKLTEITSLTGIQIAQVATADRTSFVRTTNGKVLGFGANEVGQIGLGANASVEIVKVPVEVVLARNYPGGTTVNCLDIQAGGQTTFFTVERSTPGKGTFVDLLACGNGMTGALGNGLWSSATGNPVRVKSVSGLQEYSEKVNAFLPLGIHAVSISRSPTAHVYTTLDTVSQAHDKGVSDGIYGKDVMVWGGNVDYQLGNGKRSSLAVPQHLPPLIPKAIDALSTAPGREAGMSSGTTSPMPHSRLQLHLTKANTYDLEGKLIKRNVTCEETVVACWNASVLYNKIVD